MFNPKSDLNLSAPVAAEIALPELVDDVSSALSSTDAHTRILRVYGLMEANGLNPWDSECRTPDVGVNTPLREEILARMHKINSMAKCLDRNNESWTS